MSSGEKQGDELNEVEENLAKLGQDGVEQKATDSGDTRKVSSSVVDSGDTR